MASKFKKPARKVRPGPVSAMEASRRDRLIIKVATAEFLSKGYERATIDAIALKCRISKTTIYSLFGNKEVLFSHIATASIARYRYSLEHALDPKRPFKDVIRNVVEIMVEATHVKSANEILRLAVAERERFPSIGRMMLDHSFDLVRPLGDYLATVARKGSLAKTEPLQLAYHLMEMACGGYGSILVGATTLYTDRKEWIRVVTRLFTEGFPLA